MIDPRIDAWGHPVLRSVVPVVERSRHVSTSQEAIAAVASWMAYEEFPTDGGAGPFDFGPDQETIVDYTFLLGALDFAFTDFASGVPFRAQYLGRTWSDAEGMFARAHEAFVSGIPLTDGEYLATVRRADLERIFHGNIELPMLDERVEIMNALGAVLGDRYHGRFHEFVAGCAPTLYSAGDGLLERMVAEFARFNDVSDYRGHEVQIHKLAQLTLWSLHRARAGSGWELHDLEGMTAFADYIVPLALQAMAILEYTAELEATIAAGDLIARDSEEEIEIRAHTLYATALLTDAINAIRPPGLRLVIPQVDYRLWSRYHATFRRHHLTKTIMY